MAENTDIVGEESASELAIQGAGDWPVESLAEDRMGRANFAQALADEILAAPVAGGFVMGLTGPWGVGKTSILNMVLDALGDRVLVIQFNPWMFSGTESLIGPFFREVAKQLGQERPKLKAIGEKLATYGRLLSPFAGLVGASGAVDTAAGLLAQFSAEPSVVEQRAELRKLLAELDQRLVVVLDDVDRLRPDEIADIVRLVRLVGDFPNTLYLLAFDRFRVEECLGDGDPKRGRAYLEKIVQVTHDVPEARQPDITALFLEGLQPLLDELPTGPLHIGDWQDIYTFIVQPLLQTPRDVRRLVQSLPMTLRLVGDEVALEDVLGLEAIRMLRPEMFRAIVSSAEGLCATPGTAAPGFLSGADLATGPVGPLVELDRDLAKVICRWLFPAARRYFENMHYGPEFASTWRRERRVASVDVLRFYLERRLPENVVPARVIDELLAALSDRQTLSDLLAGLEPGSLLDAITRVTDAVREVPFDAAADPSEDPAFVSLPVFLDVLPRLPVRRISGFDMGPTMTVARLVLRLIDRVTDAAVRTSIVREAVSETSVLSAALTVLDVVGHRPNVGQKLVPLDDVTQMKDELRVKALAAGAAAILDDPNPTEIAELMIESEEGREAFLTVAEDDSVVLSLLTDARAATSSRQLDSVSSKVTAVLMWDNLVALLGEPNLLRGVAALAERAADHPEDFGDDQLATIDLAARYATGWRPENLIQRMLAQQQTEAATAQPQEAAGETEPPAPDTPDGPPAEDGPANS